MMLIAIGLSTAVIVGVPVLMYAIDTLNTTSQMQEAQLAAEQILNATRNVDQGITNSTSITAWIGPGVTVTAGSYQLLVEFNGEGLPTRTWSELYYHSVVIDNPLVTDSSTAPYTVEIVLVDSIIHISFFAVPI
jgi:hypothetical protein